MSATTQQRIGVRVPGAPKTPKSNWNILIWIGILILLAINIFFLSGCNPTKQVRDTDEPIGPYHILEGGISYGPLIFHREGFSETIECDHFFVHQAIPLDTLYNFDPFMYPIIDDIRKADGWSCICIYCKTKHNCY